jgi:ADP-ribose pyrophosphatase YjhB (NUDIX family)
VPTPDFILALREKIGHDLLFLPGLAIVVLDDRGRLLLTRRRDAPERWALIGGILEPGEQPAVGAVREVAEETGVDVTVDKLAAVVTDAEPDAYPNGDRVQFLTLVFLCRWAAGEPHVADDENLEVGWFDLKDRPALGAVGEARLSWALSAGDAPILST